MGFNRPAIHVYQELVSTNVSTATPFFELCVVGPSYQVVKEVKVTDYDAAQGYAVAYANQFVGTVVDQASAKLTVKDAFIKLWPATSALTHIVDMGVSGALTTVSVQAPDTGSYNYGAAGVHVGDIARITYTDMSTTPARVTKYTSFIQDMDSTGLTITLKRNIPVPVASEIVTVTIERAVGTDLVVPSSLLTITNSGVSFTNPGTLTSTLNGVPYTVTSGMVYLSYRALRKYLSGDFTTIESMSDVRATLGDVDADNPLATACGIVISNAAVKFKVLPIETDDNNGYLKALDLLSTNEKVYVIVPLTQDKDIISAYGNHCTAMSTPEKSKWRVTYANMRMPQSKIIVDRNDGTLDAGAAAVNGALATNYLKDIANGDFITNNVIVGDFVDVYTFPIGAQAGTYMYSLKVKDVLNETVCELFSDRYIKTSDGYDINSASPTMVIKAQTAMTYEVNRVLSTQGIADAMVEIANSFKNKRIRLVEPDIIMLNINGVDYIMPGYYLCVAYGAMRAGFPPHQGFTTLGVGGIKRIFRSNKFFKDTQLDEMAGGGVFWVVQDEPEALPYCIYQTTTDTTQLETTEDSVVATIDFASKFYKDNLKAVLGRFNVNEISTKYVATVINDVTDKMLRMKYPYIGSIIISGTLKTMTTKADKIIPTVAIKVPFPVNAVDLYLEV